MIVKEYIKMVYHKAKIMRQSRKVKPAKRPKGIVVYSIDKNCWRTEKIIERLEEKN